jgi:hypothetical protein
MIAVVSPAKRLDFETQIDAPYTLAQFPDKTKRLVHVMQKKDANDLQQLMSISENIADLNVERFHNFKEKHLPENAKQCVFAFKGDVYQGLDPETLSGKEIEFAQEHLLILSGLYGVLRPLDLIQPYRLEMGTKLAFDDYQTLYDFWQGKITHTLNQQLQSGDGILLNLASEEYFKAVKRKEIKGRIIDVEFKDLKNDQYKIISFYAKKARGLMARFMIKEKVQQVEELQAFNYSGYYFDANESTEEKLSFKRDH